MAVDEVGCRRRQADQQHPGDELVDRLQLRARERQPEMSDPHIRIRAGLPSERYGVDRTPVVRGLPPAASALVHADVWSDAERSRPAEVVPSLRLDPEEPRIDAAIDER